MLSRHDLRSLARYVARQARMSRDSGASDLADEMVHRALALRSLAQSLPPQTSSSAIALAPVMRQPHSAGE